MYDYITARASMYIMLPGLIAFVGVPLLIFWYIMKSPERLEKFKIFGKKIESKINKIDFDGDKKEEL